MNKPASELIALADLRTANATRQAEWDPDNQLTLAYRGNELAGEVGEACNVIKKLEREQMGIPGSRDTIAHLAEELADVMICADLIASSVGVDLDQAVRDKFNATSEKHGFKTRLAAIDRIDVTAEAKSQEPDAVAIKPLEWVDNDSERVGSRAQTILGEYVTWISEDECCYLQLASQFKGHPHGASIDAAKAAAQADYEQRIRSALIHPTTKPEAPAVSVDAETIDAVARIIDPTAWKMEHGYWMEQAHAYEAISKATAIAALISRGR